MHFEGTAAMRSLYVLLHQALLLLFCRGMERNVFWVTVSVHMVSLVLSVCSHLGCAGNAIT